MAKTATRQQMPKQRTGSPVRSRSIETMEFMLAGRGGTHRSARDYQRRPKHRNNPGWE